MYQESQKRRSYIIYILFFFLSGSLVLIDFFSNKKFSDTILNRVEFLFPINEKAANTLVSLDFDFFESRSDLINENARLKNEVIELRKLKLVNEELINEIISNDELIKNVQIEDYVYLKSSLLIKNTTNEYIISGGRNLNLNINDLVLNEEGFVIGYLTKIFDDHSLISTVLNSNFSIPGIDKHGNEYLITSNNDELLVNSILIKEKNVNVDYIFTDIAFDHPGKFPIVDLSQEEVSELNNKISSTVKVNYRFSFDSNIYIVKKK